MLSLSISYLDYEAQSETESAENKSKCYSEYGFDVMPKKKEDSLKVLYESVQMDISQIKEL